MSEVSLDVDTILCDQERLVLAQRESFQKMAQALAAQQSEMDRLTAEKSKLLDFAASALLRISDDASEDIDVGMIERMCASSTSGLDEAKRILQEALKVPDTTIQSYKKRTVRRKTRRQSSSSPPSSDSANLRDLVSSLRQHNDTLQDELGVRRKQIEILECKLSRISDGHDIESIEVLRNRLHGVEEDLRQRETQVRELTQRLKGCRMPRCDSLSEIGAPTSVPSSPKLPTSPPFAAKEPFFTICLTGATVIRPPYARPFTVRPSPIACPDIHRHTQLR